MNLKIQPIELTLWQNLVLLGLAVGMFILYGAMNKAWGSITARFVEPIALLLAAVITVVDIVLTLLHGRFLTAIAACFLVLMAFSEVSRKLEDAGRQYKWRRERAKQDEQEKPIGGPFRGIIAVVRSISEARERAHARNLELLREEQRLEEARQLATQQPESEEEEVSNETEPNTVEV